MAKRSKESILAEMAELRATLAAPFDNTNPSARRQAVDRLRELDDELVSRKVNVSKLVFFGTVIVSIIAGSIRG